MCEEVVDNTRGLTILQKAQLLVYGDRQAAYGAPHVDFSRTAKMWSGAFDREFTPEEVALAMILVKVSRLCNSPDHRDSVTDIAGYAATLERVQNWRNGDPNP